MKKIILFLLLCVSLTAYTQTDSTLVTNTTAEKLIDKYSAKVEAAIVSLAENLKQPVEHVYKILIKQQIVRAWVWASVNGVIFLLTILLWILWLQDDDRDEWWGLPTFITFILVGFIATTLPTVFTGFLNPEYGALQDIIQMIK
jgi:hypothetical protein